MKRTALILLSSFLFLTVASLFAYMLRYTDLGEAYIYLIIGVGILIASSVLAYFSAEHIPLNIICFFLSSAALGFLIRSWYIFRDFDNTVGVMLLVSLACLAHLLLFCLVAELPPIKRHKAAAAVIYGIISLGVYLYVVFTTKTTFVSTFGYYMIVEIAFLWAIIASGEDRASLIRSITLSTFSVFGVAVIIALMMLSGGDCDISGCDCDCGCDCNPGDGGKKKKGSTDISAD